MQATSYNGTELGDWGFTPTEATVLKEELQARNLEMLGAFVLGIFPILMPMQWAVFAAGVEYVARLVRAATGIRCVFHHHCAGFVETPAEIEKLLALTDPELVGLCFDTGHYIFGGGDAVEGVRKYASRIWHFHFKDHEPNIAAQARQNEWDFFASVRHGIFCELGKGDVDFPAVNKELEKAGYDRWGVIEQDVLPGMGSPKESAA